MFHDQGISGKVQHSDLLEYLVFLEEHFQVSLPTLNDL